MRGGKGGLAHLRDWSPRSGEEHLVLNQADGTVREGDGGRVSPGLQFHPLI